MSHFIDISLVRIFRWLKQSKRTKQNKTRSIFKNVCVACLLQVWEWKCADGSREMPQVAFQLDIDKLGPHPHGIVMVTKWDEAGAIYYLS